MQSKQKKKQIYRQYILIGSVIMAFVIFYEMHYTYVRDNQPEASNYFTSALTHMASYPFQIIPFGSGTFMTILVTLIFVFFVIFVVYESVINRQHYNSETVQGDAKWLDDLDEFNKRFNEPYGSTSNDGPNNIIYSQDILMGLDAKKINRNLNAFVIGGSGSGKSYRLVGPNLLQCNCSYIITDPSGDLFAEYGSFFEYMGYKVKCLNLQHMEKSNHYNPFNYIHSDKDVEILVSTLISNTTPPDQHGGDPFWEKSEQALLVSIIAYLNSYGEKEEKNFTSVMRYMRMADIEEDSRGYGNRFSTSSDKADKKTLDSVFDELEKTDPDSFALKQYKTFKMGAGKTLKSILISAAVRLQAFDLIDVENLTGSDDIALDAVGDEKTALFVMLPTADKTFNFLASMMYSQLFQRLYDYAENYAHFSTLIMDDKGQVVRTFRANDEAEAQNKWKDAQKLLEDIRKIKKPVRRKEFETEIGEKKTQWWELRTAGGTLVAYRGSEEEAYKALASIKNGKVMSNSEQSNNGKRMPIHVRMMLDEFANIGKIPEFPEKVSTIRKYEISTTIILQSLSQLKAMYKEGDQWETLSGNCDTTIYLGGGADAGTTEWLSKLMGKETRTVLNTSYQSGGGGSSSYNKEGVELFAPSQFRVIPEDECIILIRSLDPYKGKKYDTEKHRNRKLQLSLPRYYFNAEKARTLYKEYENANVPENVKNENNRPLPFTESEEKAISERNKDMERKAEEYRQNRASDGKKIIEDPTQKTAADIQKEIGISSEEDVKEKLLEVVDLNNEFLAPSDILYASMPQDN